MAGAAPRRLYRDDQMLGRSRTQSARAKPPVGPRARTAFSIVVRWWPHTTGPQKQTVGNPKGVKLEPRKAEPAER